MGRSRDTQELSNQFLAQKFQDYSLLQITVFLEEIFQNNLHVFRLRLSFFLIVAALYLILTEYRFAVSLVFSGESPPSVVLLQMFHLQTDEQLTNTCWDTLSFYGPHASSVASSVTAFHSQNLSSFLQMTTNTENHGKTQICSKGNASPFRQDSRETDIFSQNILHFLSLKY